MVIRRTIQTQDRHLPIIFPVFIMALLGTPCMEQSEAMDQERAFTATVATKIIPTEVITRCFMVDITLDTRG